jgi:linoleoyl-CoA desaturase
MRVLKGRVNLRLGQRPGKDHFKLYLKSFIIFMWMGLSFLALYLLESNSAKMIACLSLGISSAGLGFNLLHDAAHGSLSSNKKINRFFSFVCCSLLGAGSYFWRHKHNYLHHQFPNIQDWDDDLETRDGLRLSHLQPKSIRYKYQHLYAPFLYALTTIEWLFVKDFVQYFTLRMNKWQKIPKMKPSDHVEFWAAKIIYYSLFVALPLYTFSVPQALVGLLIFHFSFSLTLAAVFQLAHVMEECEFPEVDQASGKIDLGWAELQLRTTTNFAPSNQFMTWFSGGLNYQVEHHLFPYLSHTYYPEIAADVKKTCAEFNYPYHSIPTYTGAIRSHYNTLKKLGFYAQPIKSSKKVPA